MTRIIDYPHIEVPEGGAARLRRVPRIRVSQIVLDHLAHGWSAEEIGRQHPGLTASEIHSALAYYFDHQQQVDDEIRAEWDQIRRDRAAAARSPFVARMRAKGLI